MSEYDELVKKLRCSVPAYDISVEAATALEAQSRQIALLAEAARLFEDAARAWENNHNAAQSEVERLKGVLEFVDLNISKDNGAAKEAIRSALEAKP